MPEYTAPRFLSSALIVIDMQNDFVLPGASACVEGTSAVVPQVAELVNAYRQVGLPVIHIVRLYEPDGTNADLCRRAHIQQAGGGIAEPGTEGAQIVEALRPSPTLKLDTASLLAGHAQAVGEHEFIFYKPRWGAFYGTALEVFLREHGIDTLVFAGCNFPNCPRTSIYEASERDFRLVLARDAVSQLYPKGEEELASIGVRLMGVGAIRAELGL
ncbi:isochorismatase family cysteine hydrolase [Ruficoccus sp. ZRK36]|uniref:cysteine hydrolase family protein n=1 Tax=Ruficoccus sp. ZRK36 TaxID=2866311 RepID=UPI001C734328|nr:isochorismatase family cysteine hydrolase [Ruficoccus sp. ZRK36]QYY37220.1 cysteine hydrolase [Ruficoccus sp. ZRK36]